MQGTEKQIRYAHRVRHKIKNNLENYIKENLCSISNKLKEESFFNDAENIKKDIKFYEKITIDYLDEIIDEASFILDNQYKEYIFILEAIKLLNNQEEYKRIKEKKKIDNEAIIQNELYKHKYLYVSPVYFEVYDNCLKIYCQYDDEINQYCRKNGLYRGDKCWIKIINEQSGKAEDRIVQYGAFIYYNKGYPLKIYSKDLKKKILECDYIPEHTRWIDSESDYLYIVNNSKKLIKIASKINNSILENENKVIIKIEEYEQLIDFAEIFNFKFTTEAKNLIETYKMENGIDTKLKYEVNTDGILLDLVESEGE